MQLKTIIHNDRQIELVLPELHSNDSNTYTLLVGINGAGKSRLLQTICQTLLNDSFLKSHTEIDYSKRATNTEYQLNNETYRIFHPERVRLQATVNIKTPDGLTINKNIVLNASSPTDYFIEGDVDGIDIKGQYQYLLESYFRNDNTVYQCISNSNQSYKPIPNLIAVTSSPFDKFPTHESMSDTKYYYRGSRVRKNAGSNDIKELDYIGQKFNQLGSSFLNLFLKERTRLDSVKKMFRFLGYNFQFELNLSLGQQFGFTGNNTNDLLSSTESIRFFKGHNRNTLSSKQKELINKDLESSFHRVRDFYKVNIGAFFDKSSNINLKMDLNAESQDELLDDLILLANYDILDLGNVTFTKEVSNTSFLLSDASSGELCLLFNILAIAGVIQNDSLILIDEPELSLHPKWQEDFIPLLCDIFSNYNGCHFVISTHSPNIVSTLPETNSFLVNLESIECKAVSGNSIKNKSIDYQMTRTFDVNSSNNEYLIRITLEVFFYLSKKKTLPQGELLEEFQYLVSIKHKVQDSKLLDLIDSCIELGGLYG